MSSPINPVEIIVRKRDAQTLSREEIRQVISQFTAGELPDYQMSALAMAIVLRGMERREVVDLTQAMVDSGRQLTWPPDGIPRGDKHSTGGIGDKVSLILAPLLACCGLHVPKISGRGLGPTGGTLDKLESIPGFRTHLSLEETQRLTQQIGCVITGAGGELAPADRKLYALRDVTGTVNSIPLITASILSKKLAEGLDALVLDVKAGSGAFMKTLDQGRTLARLMVEVANELGVRTTALLTDMHQPLGRMVGNTLEIDEILRVLRGEESGNLLELTLRLGAELLVSTRQSSDLELARHQLQIELSRGAAYERFTQMVAAQGGDLSQRIPPAPCEDWTSDREGYLKYVDIEALGWAVIELGGGRKQAHDDIDHAVGLECLKQTGDWVSRGEPVFRIFARTGQHGRIGPHLRRAITIQETVPPEIPLIHERVADGMG